MTNYPDSLAAWVREHPRQEAIHNHGFRLNIGKWNALVGHLPGTPLVGEDGSENIGLISRGGLFRLAGEAQKDDSGTAALRLFWHSLAWGTGSSHRNTPGRSEPSPLTPPVQRTYCAKRRGWPSTIPKQRFFS